MSLSISFEQFKSLALELDFLEGNEEWKKRPESDHYDYCLIGSRLEVMKDLLNRGDNTRELMRVLRSGLHRNLGGLQNKSLFSKTYYGTKYLIEEYISNVVKTLLLIKDDPSVSLKEKFEFFWDCRQSFGRSALLLSGGASLGLYHFGVIKALFEQDLLPKVISGSSVGSIVASLISTKTDEELIHLFKSLDFEFNAFEKNVFFAKLIRFVNAV